MKRHLRSLPYVARGFKAAAVGFSNRLRYGEAKARAAFFAGAVFVDAVEALEDVGQLIGGDAGAFVRHLDIQFTICSAR